VCKSSNKIDDRIESGRAEIDRNSGKSSSSVALNSSSSKSSAQYGCDICKVTLHSSGDQQAQGAFTNSSNTLAQCLLCDPSSTMASLNQTGQTACLCEAGFADFNASSGACTASFA